jgi:acetyl-CoA carboxylase biotin carboxyl carrier protein
MKKNPKSIDKTVPPAGPKPSRINFDEVTKLIGLVDEKKLSHFELETEGFRIIIGRNTPAPPVPHVINSAPVEHAYTPPSRVTVDGPAPDYAREDDETPVVEPKGELRYIASPIVGTFYRAPDPSSAPFVEVGDVVKKKQTLCIVEAMKLMNEIECDLEGVVKEIYVENGKPVEFGQRLFGIQVVG